MSDAKALKRTKFEQVFTVIRDELVDYVKAQNVPQDALKWFTDVREDPDRRRGHTADGRVLA